MVLDPVLVCISGLWVRMLWAPALGVVPSLYSCRLSHGVFVASCVFVLAAIICAFTPDVGMCLPFCFLDVLICAVIPQPSMMRLIASFYVNTPLTLLSSLRYADVWALSLQLAGSLSQCWSSMLPSAFVLSTMPPGLVVLMWWTCQTSCFRKLGTGNESMGE